MNIHKSYMDESVNVTKTFGNSIIESRYVCRERDQTIIYVSSHNGCKMACRFCHLTATKQTEMEPVTPKMFGEQVRSALKYSQMTSRLNINFMARGEPLENQYITDPQSWIQIVHEIHNGIGEYWPADYYKKVNFNISTIIPKSVTKKDTLAMFPFSKPNIYWSLYSTSEKFRKKWIPKAASLDESIKFLKDTPKEKIIIHMAFIKGENDDPKDIQNIRNFLEDNFAETPKINIVRYNPFSPKHGVESDFIEDIRSALGPTCNIVDRIGFDVSASCGMFMRDKK